jgi:4-amino-4-deoxy-L-arabinose transferase-like glycosyltransferase
MKTTTSTNPRSSDLRIALLCAALTALAFLAVNPFVEMPFDDDWSYAWTVKQFLATGHILYHGWSTAAIITHVLWGALFAKIFGFSFTVLRFSTLPLAVASVALSYLLARQAGLSAKSSLFVAMTLALSPVFLPLATSFMTDVPGLFFILFSLYCLVLACTTQRSALWIILAVVVSILGGMGRQVDWLVTLAILPYVAFLLRRRPRLVALCAIGWLLVVANAALTTAWFNHQPDVMIDRPFHQSLVQVEYEPAGVLIALLKIALTTILLALPAVIPFCLSIARRTWRERRGRLGLIVVIALLLISAALLLWPTLDFEPWVGNILTPRGVLGDIELAGDRPTAQPQILSDILSAITHIAFGLILIAVLDWLSRPALAFKDFRQFFAAADGQVAMPMIALFTAAYLFVLIPRISESLIFDRYLIELLPLLAIALLRRFPSPGTAPIFLLSVYALFALASTQDVLALARARAAAAQRLQAAGVPRTAFVDGFEFNYWTQLQAQGFINRAGVTNANHPFNQFLGMKPAILPRYRVEWNPRSGETVPTPFGSIDFISWLPPFHRRINIDQFRNPWWLDPNHKTTQPIPRYWEDYEAYFN